MTPPPPASSSSRKGIDIRDALSILSARAKDGGGGERHHHDVVTDEMKRMGQTIDVAPPNDDGGGGGEEGGVPENESPPSVEEEKEEVERRRREVARSERERMREEMREELRSMGVSELLRTIFMAQQERVATYREYEEGLAAVLASGNVTAYPALCAKVTASFSALSDAVNAVKSTMAENHPRRRDATDAIVRLQKSEGEKLSLTAALHLERLRSRNARLEVEANAASEGG
eukprot:CAMPEP_0172552404 /NCGR_PEP_ID=MMETSP1067-20121228/44776_1 /TAXON_ID=265564 ORGANISM="Thalassiosira punctigera, Strain Tpunct2005C2" /NCGR_SAMPLE_ID=MMETSP1067 /ASSEMBLY_ACC=CAM_ASM_000444 /LENGTH=231 /DNA_ID=CAMNT_0013340383 /DNA_START=55 /DNA_END=746 /DNA_ORIENTATION=-